MSGDTVITPSQKQYPVAMEAYKHQRTYMVIRRLKAMGLKVPDQVPIDREYVNLITKRMCYHGLKGSDFSQLPGVQFSYMDVVVNRHDRPPSRSLSRKEPSVEIRPKKYKELEYKRSIKTRQTIDGGIWWFDPSRRLQIQFRDQERMTRFLKRMEDAA